MGRLADVVMVMTEYSLFMDSWQTGNDIFQMGLAQVVMGRKVKLLNRLSDGFKGKHTAVNGRSS
jgi:hypothetical protein